MTRIKRTLEDSMEKIGFSLFVHKEIHHVILAKVRGNLRYNYPAELLGLHIGLAKKLIEKFMPDYRLINTIDFTGDNKYIEMIYLYEGDSPEGEIKDIFDKIKKYKFTWRDYLEYVCKYNTFYSVISEKRIQRWIPFLGGKVFRRIESDGHFTCEVLADCVVFKHPCFSNGKTVIAKSNLDNEVQLVFQELTLKYRLSLLPNVQT